MLKWIYSYRKEKLKHHCQTRELFYSIFVFLSPPCLRWGILVMAKLLSHNFKMPAWPLSVCLRIKLFTFKELTHYRFLYTLHTHQYTCVCNMYLLLSKECMSIKSTIHFFPFPLGFKSQRWCCLVFSCDIMTYILYMGNIWDSYRDTHLWIIAGSFSSCWQHSHIHHRPNGKLLRCGDKQERREAVEAWPL